MPAQASSIYGGAVMNMNISDLEPRYEASTVAMSQKSATFTSNALNLGCRAVKIEPVFESKDVVCDIELYKVVNNVDILVKAWTGLTPGHSVYAGNFEFINLDGLPIKVKLVSVTGGWVTINVLPMA